MGKLKLNTLLAVTSTEQGAFKSMVKDFMSFFSHKQGAFRGIRDTYEPEPNVVDEPNRRKNEVVQTTVGEKFDWLLEESENYLKSLFTTEKANANGVTANLVVAGEDWGEYTTLELLRLKGLLEDSNLMTMFTAIPVRSDSEVWEETDDDQYTGRDGIYESPLQEGDAKTTVKESYILPDPNIAKMGDSAQYTPQVAVKNNVHVLGQYTHQKFTGEWSQRQRAQLLMRRNDLHTAVVKALKEANDVEVTVESDLGTAALTYIIKG